MLGRAGFLQPGITPLNQMLFWLVICLKQPP